MPSDKGREMDAARYITLAAERCAAEKHCGYAANPPCRRCLIATIETAIEQARREEREKVEREYGS